MLQCGNDLAAHINLDEGRTLPARSQIRAKSHLVTDLTPGVRPRGGRIRMRVCLLIAMMPFLTSEEIPIYLMNVSDYPVTLKRGSNLGHCLTV